jgi:hypothetical protein
MLMAVALLVLCQQPIDPIRATEVAGRIAMAQSALANSRQKGLDAQAKREFTERFNHLITALENFEEAYSGSRGEVWPVKQAAKLDAAMRELSTAPGWRPTN